METAKKDMADDGVKKILVVEDDTDISHLVSMHLEDEGYQVSVAGDGDTGMSLARRGGYDLIVLDLMLPGISGMEICKNIRQAGDHTPILMLTAKSTELDRVLGLEVGADDYLTKPFSVRELVARVKAIFRRVDVMRADGEAEGDQLVRGDLVIDRDKRKVTLGGETVSLTAREYDLLIWFAAHPGRVYTRAQLLDQVWGYGYDGYEHTVNSHINRLRGKVEEDPARPRYILTVWGVGYKFADADDLAGAGK
jgi:DNA-binding response OmpR family regulator